MFRWSVNQRKWYSVRRRSTPVICSCMLLWFCSSLIPISPRIRSPDASACNLPQQPTRWTASVHATPRLVADSAAQPAIYLSDVAHLDRCTARASTCTQAVCPETRKWHRNLFEIDSYIFCSYTSLIFIFHKLANLRLWLRQNIVSTWF